MLKRLTGVVAALMLAAPAIAEPEVKYYSYDSLGCMMLLECKDDVQEVKSVADIKAILTDSNYDKHEEELNRIFTALGKVGVKVHLAGEQYFPRNHRGIYDVKNNYFFLSKGFVWDEGHLIGVMRHEAWHAAQDCMAGTIDNTFTAVILQDGTVPQFYMDTVDRLYPPKPRPWEYEAFFAGATPNMTAEAVEACASATPMWETYNPTPMTREWLTNQGFMASIEPQFPVVHEPTISADAFINDTLNRGYIQSYGYPEVTYAYDYTIRQNRMVVPGSTVNYYSFPYNNMVTTW
jgi:hypothetical protein